MKLLYKKHYLFISMISLILLLVLLLSYYPGLVSYDGNNQWQQVQSGIITNAHPFFSTFFMLLLSKIWNSITIVVIYQILLVSISWGYLCKVIKTSNKIQTIVMYMFTVIVMLLPLTSLFSITVWKDIIYTSYLFLCSIMLYDWFSNNYKFSILKYSLLGIMISMVYSYRHNGIIVAIMLLIMFYIICIMNYRKKVVDKSCFKTSFIVILTFISMIALISIPKTIMLEKSSKIMKKTNSKEASLSTVDGYMVWMMGAHIQDDNIKNKKDQEFLNKIIPLGEWENVYYPYLINGTNLASGFDKEYLANNDSKFHNMFIKYSKKYPLTIIKHYLKADSLLINPVSSLNGYVYVFCFPEMGYLPKYTTIRPLIPGVRQFYLKCANFSLKKPFIMFYEPAFILYLSLIITFILSKRVYGKKIWLFSMPMILNTISLLPINLAQDLRYVYINYWTFYGLSLIFILNIKTIFSKKSLAFRS